MHIPETAKKSAAERRFDHLAETKQLAAARDAVTKIIDDKARRLAHGRLREAFLEAGQVGDAREVSTFAGLPFGEAELRFGGHQATIRGDLATAIETRRALGLPLEFDALATALQWAESQQRGGEPLAVAVRRCLGVWDDVRLSRAALANDPPREARERSRAVAAARFARFAREVARAALVPESQRTLEHEITLEVANAIGDLVDRKK